MGSPGAALDEGSEHDAGTSGTRAFLRSLGLFADLDDGSLAHLAARVETIVLAGGEVLMRQGEPADCLYVLRVGRLRVTARVEDGSDRVLGHVGRGEAVGEMALIGDEPRSATVVAERDSELVRVPTEAFEELVVADPLVLRRLTTQVVGRMRRAQDAAPQAPPTSTVTVLVLGGAPRVVQAAADLVEALAGDVEGATAVDADRAAGGEGGRAALDGGDGRAAAGWLGGLERVHPLVVLAADRGHAGWSRWCARQSDLVLAVADASAPADVGDLATIAAERRQAVGARVELVLVRPDWMQDARDTAAWLAPGAVDRHHHLCADSPADLRRVVRLVRGRAVAVVLSGGGARGVADIGVLRALEEVGLPIDAVGGTSIGALVGGALARGWGWERIEATVRAGVAQGRGVIDPTVPAVALAAGRRVTRRLREAADDMDLEDLLLDYFCVSTDLSHKTPREHDRGPAWRAVRASLAIPGMFPPVPEGDDVLIDGGLLENFPVARMRRRHPGVTVVGVDVGSRRDLLALGLPESCELSTMDIVRAVLGRRFRGGAVTLSRVLAGVTELGLEDDAATPPDVTVRPSVQDIPILAFSRFDELVDRGYREGLRVLGPWAQGRPEAGVGGRA